MNNKKIAFIICVNSEMYFQECLWYINRLSVPDGYEIDVIAIREANSMCAAYNAAMKSSCAKYKIYLHQDVMIRNNCFLEDIIHLFQADQTVGMIGMIGGTHLPKTGVVYRAWNFGIVDCRDPDMSYYWAGVKDMGMQGTIVEAVDGLLIATQYDIPWRDDLFVHFDFYDISQSFEMRKAGYRILVPYQKEPWVVHDAGFAKLTYYDEERKKCLAEYSQFLYEDGGFEFFYDRQWNELSDLLVEQLKQLIELRNWEQIETLLESYCKMNRKSSNLEVIRILNNIHKKEEKAHVNIKFFDDTLDYQSLYEKYMKIRFKLRRMELGLEKSTYEDLINAIRNNLISCEALIEIILHAVIDKKTVVHKIAEIYYKEGDRRSYMKCKRIYELVEKIPFPITHCGEKQSI